MFPVTLSPLTATGIANSSVANPDPNLDPDLHVFGPPGADPDPLIRGVDPDPAPDLDPSITKQK